MNYTLQQIRSDLRTIAERLDAYEAKSVSIPGRMITIESILSDLGSLALRVAAFDKQQKTHTVQTALGEIEAQDGEEYAGLIVSADGTKKHHLFLLPDERERINWEDAKAWAESIGGELPDRVESALLFATMKDHFKPGWHWTRGQHAASFRYAWFQNFDHGSQGSYNINDEIRARAIRRVAI